jgi:nicotinamidase-related amidase
MGLSDNYPWGLAMSEYIDLLISDFRSDHPSIVEEWERQREDALEHDDPAEDWPAITTPDGLAWWLHSEIDVAEEYQRRQYSAEDNQRERGIAAYCLAMLVDLERHE